MPKSRHAFTLIELLTVIAIIAILAGIFLAVTGAARESARRSRAQSEISAIQTALTRFEVDFGFFPEISFIGNATELTDDEYPSYNDAPEDYQLTGRALFYALQGIGYFTNIPDDFEETQTNRPLMDLAVAQVDDRDSVTTIEGSDDLNRRIRSAYHDSENFQDGPMVVDPWGFPYGYFYRSRQLVNADQSASRGQRSIHNFELYDLWSTRDAERDREPERWITNWGR